MWPKAKRAVSDQTAAAIAAAAKQHGAQPVGVFVDEDAATITRRCKAAGIPLAQLHGDGSRAALNDIPSDLQVGRHMQCCAAYGSELQQRSMLNVSVLADNRLIHQVWSATQDPVAKLCCFCVCCCCRPHCRVQVVYVLQADDSGQIVTPIPGAAGGPAQQRSIEWILVDGMTVSR